ncbi:hypothetical protein FGF1_38470 [Flavobacteriaceae bacterium GF1]
MGFPIYSNEMGQRFRKFCGNTTGYGEDNKNGDHLPTLINYPTVFKLFEAPKKKPYHDPIKEGNKK